MLEIVGGVLLAFAILLAAALLFFNFRAFVALFWTAACVSVFIYLVGSVLVR